MLVQSSKNIIFEDFLTIINLALNMISIEFCPCSLSENAKRTLNRHHLVVEQQKYFLFSLKYSSAAEMPNTVAGCSHFVDQKLHFINNNSIITLFHTYSLLRAPSFLSASVCYISTLKNYPLLVPLVVVFYVYPCWNQSPTVFSAQILSFWHADYSFYIVPGYCIHIQNLWLSAAKAVRSRPD